MWNVIKSVLAAFFGVQKERRRQEDFTHGEPIKFIVVGILLAIVLVVVIAMIALTVAG
ncbi:DUF2970 domain-containing protein [Aidingimonas halophila]|uniref:DUF2970 domain-containing protein n=1 Tax=Aidingimonas halophila TaxID=574349 RepID=A0A1H3BZ14_9GAMM|nr:DUF2970 domain-containing protein [Aidingimonas halophila]GHC27346.1 hypothetical protein GCM10008094_18720 [Aidingimonas halophila]SDX47106.1 Protein of unknown function [Aidingimonas halophila]